MSALRFKIGDAFPADDPIARFVTGLAMICNDWLRFMGDFAAAAAAVDTDASSETGARHVAIFRFQAALLHEATDFIDSARRRFPEIAQFIEGLDVQARDDHELLMGIVDPRSREFLGEWLTPHRNVTFHYPELHPDKARNGQEDMAIALAKASWIESEITEVEWIGKVRFYFADEVGAQLLPEVRDGLVLERFGRAGESLARFAQLAMNAYLKTRYREDFAVTD